MFRILNINHKKNGDPIALVINPTGNSAGIIIVLEMRSDKIIINAPANIDPLRRKL